MKVNRPDKTLDPNIFDDNKKDGIPRVGKGLVKKLLDTGIILGKELKNLPPDRIEQFVVSKISQTILTNLLQEG